MVRLLAENRWPFRLHATYDESITPLPRRVRSGQSGGSASTACTGSSTTPRPSRERNMDRIKALGGGIAIQHRMAFQGEYFIDRYGDRSCSARRPSGRCCATGHPGRRRHGRHARGELQPVGVAVLAGDGEDGRRLPLYAEANRLDRMEALRL